MTVTVTPPEDPRAALAGALARMGECSKRLEEHLCEETLRAFIDASNAARAAHDALVLAALNRARKGLGR